MTGPTPNRQTDWSELLRSSKTEQVALAVLHRLQWEATGPLLDLGPEIVQLLAEYFARRAEAALVELDLDREALERTRQREWMLVEEALEGTEQYAAAAASYAILHDLLLEEDADEGSLLPFEQLLMRFKLAYALDLHDESDPVHGRRLAEFAEATSAQLEAAWQRIPKTAFNFLCLRLHHWLGLLWKSLGEYDRAKEALGKAAVYADEPEDKVSTTMHFASVKEKLGDPQAAYDFLMLCRSDLPAAEEDTRHTWQVQVAGLKMVLGGKTDPSDVASLPPTFQALQRLHGQLLDQDAALDAEAVKVMEEFSRKLLEELGPEDPDLEHAVLLKSALVAGHRSETGTTEKAETYLRRAKELEARLDGEEFVLRRQLVEARILTAQGHAEEAVSRFAAIMPRARRILSSGELVEALGEYLIALGRASADLETVVEQVRAAYVHLEVLLTEQPLGSARRRMREVYQRVIEAGLTTLASAIEEREKEEEEIQNALGWAWNLLLNNRNVEIHWKAAGPGHDSKHLKEYEDAFHARLRDALVDGYPEDRSWKAALAALEDHELSAVRDSRRSKIHDMRPAADTISLAFFKLRDAFGTSRPTLVLSHYDGRFDWTVLRDGPQEAEERLEQWMHPFFKVDGQDGDGASRGVTRVSSSARSGFDDLSQAPPVTTLLPSSLVLLPTRRLRAFPPEAGDANTRLNRPMVDRPWHLFPDGLLNTLPIEMLPDHAEGAVRFGENRSITLCLRPVVPEDAGRPVDFARGWLGLGGVPAAGEISELEWSGAELRGIQELLTEHGCNRGRRLLGKEARADRLEAEIAELRPAALHFAAHGLASAEHPEACTLILADCPERAERELLPYRRIRSLPLAGVDLVVLSACSSLIGRSGRAASMEGLAWAFLSGGATQVVASRYPVDDKATSVLMLRLYEMLLRFPVAEALGRTRHFCLEEKRLAPREVAAWSVWC